MTGSMPRAYHKNAAGMMRLSLMQYNVSQAYSTKPPLQEHDWNKRWQGIAALPLEEKNRGRRLR